MKPTAIVASMRSALARPHQHARLPGWRAEALRTTFWVVPPTLLIVVAVVLFVVTFEIDLAAFHGHLSPPARVGQDR